MASVAGTGDDQARQALNGALPAFQRAGIGRSLIGHVGAAARADGATAMTLNVNQRNGAAIAAYASAGSR